MTALHLARPEDLDRLTTLVAAFLHERGQDPDSAGLRAGLSPLLDGSPHGAAYLIGPQRAPIGYVVVSFGWSLEYAGLTGRVGQIYIRPGVRGRGIGSEILTALPKALASAGLKALTIEISRGDPTARRLYTRLRFKPHEESLLMTLEP